MTPRNLCFVPSAEAVTACGVIVDGALPRHTDIAAQVGCPACRATPRWLHAAAYARDRLEHHGETGVRSVTFDDADDAAPPWMRWRPPVAA